MHKRLFTRCSLLLTLLAVIVAVLPVIAASTLQPQQPAVPEAAEKGGIVTLYALDPLANTFCFADGKYGNVFSNQGVYNRASDIAFDCYQKGCVTVGVEGPILGTIIDVGSADDLQKKYGYQDTVGKGQGFASIHRKGEKVLIKDLQPIEESAELFQQGKSNESMAVKVGHVYLLRLTDKNNKAFQRVVKMMVIAYTADESVTIRWQILD